MRRLPSLATVLLLSTAVLIGQRATDQEITAAIDTGTKGNVADLVGSCIAGPSFGQAMLQSHSVLGSYNVVMMSHLGWIAAMAGEYKRQYKPFTTKDVTAEMRVPVILVGIAPNERNGTSFAAPVQQIVVRSKATPTALVIPENLNQGQTSESAALKGGVGYQYLAKFPPGKVKALPPGDLEVVLVTEVGERRCKIGARDRAKFLPAS